MIKKIVIAPSNKKAVSFFAEIAKRKEEIKKKFEAKAFKRLSAHQN